MVIVLPLMTILRLLYRLTLSSSDAVITSAGTFTVKLVKRGATLGITISGGWLGAAKSGAEQGTTGYSRVRQGTAGYSRVQQGTEMCSGVQRGTAGYGGVQWGMAGYMDVFLMHSLKDVTLADYSVKIPEK